MRYWPPPSVTTDRAFSMSAGLEASTVTPGSTAREASFTTPVMEACANAADGIRRASSTATRQRAWNRPMTPPSVGCLLLVPVFPRGRERVGEAVRADPSADLLHRRAPRGDERRRPRAGEHLRVLDARLVFDRVAVHGAPPFGHVKRVGVRPPPLAGGRRLVAAVGEPRLRVEAGHVHDQRVAVPPRDRVAEVGRDDVLGVGEAVTVRNDAEAVVILREHDDVTGVLHDLKRPRRACRGARHAVRDAAQQRIVRLAQIAHLSQRRRRVEAFELRKICALDLAAGTARRPDARQVRLAVGQPLHGTCRAGGCARRLCRRMRRQHRHERADEQAGKAGGNKARRHCGALHGADAVPARVMWSRLYRPRQPVSTCVDRLRARALYVCSTCGAEGRAPMKRCLVALLVAAAWTCARPALAHHSFAATYLETQSVTIEGEIVQFVFRNPHSFVHVNVKEKDGTTTVYNIEWGGTGQLGGTRGTGGC